MVASGSVKRGLIWLLPLLLVCGLVLHTDPATRVVDTDGTAPFTSIQSAIDSAVPGQDDVFVRCGTYPENIVMRDGVSVRGERAQCTFLDPPLDDRAVVTMPSLGPGTTLEGFTIRNRPSLRPGSLGISVASGSPVITRNVIEGPGPSTFSGAGIAVNGGAPVISYNIIRGNYDCCWGGGLRLDSSDARVRSNLIVGNFAYYGAGILTQYGNPEIVNNTITRNDGWLGSGIMIMGDGAIVVNNAVAFNTAVINGGGITDWSVAASIEANDVFGNQPDNYSTADLEGTDGNISADPRFLDEDETSFAGFQPRSFSPLIDAGATALASGLDIRGISRPVDGDADSFARPDIGARENEGVTGLLHTGVEFLWDPGNHLPHDYNIYRGDLATLKQTGVYTQDPLDGDGARHFCDFSNSLGDSDLPGPGQVFFYLPAAYGAIEGTLGFDSRLVERPKGLSCMPS